MNLKGKLITFFIIFGVISYLFGSKLIAFAQTSAIFKSNNVITQIGSPTDPKPGTNTGSGSSNSIITCPLSKDGSGSFNITCGTAKNPASNGCGHAIPPIYPACKSPPYASCPFSPQLKAAIDVRPANSSGGGVPVYLPYINGNELVEWTKISGPIGLTGFGGEFWGEKLEYQAKGTDGKTYHIDLTHLGKSIEAGAKTSGDQVGSTLVGLDGGTSGHLHTAVAVDGVWMDAISEAHVCTQ